MITGFIPKRDAKGLEEKLNSRFELAVESSDVPEDEEAPVLLSNGTFAASAEGVTASFGLPAKGEMDPTGIMAACYVFLFGLMLSDAAYGFIVFLMCFLALKKFPRMEENLRKSLAALYVLWTFDPVLGRHVRRLFRRCGGHREPDVFWTYGDNTGALVCPAK